jgi:predicted small lipoprotein YifL
MNRIWIALGVVALLAGCGADGPPLRPGAAVAEAS